MAARKVHTVTGATGYTGRYITKLLLEQGRAVQSITGHPERHNPFGDQVPPFPFDFDHPEALTRTLAGTDTLFNTYWVRVNYRDRSHEQCVEQTKVMFQAAKAAGVRRIVHISITNPDPASPLPYFRGKGQLEDALRDLGLSYAILRPTVLYSVEDILLNNIAWTVRKFPIVPLPGSGKYGIQPVFVEDLAKLAVDAAASDDNVEIDAVGPEVSPTRKWSNWCGTRLEPAAG
jgi:NADH dehydrogenase